MSIKGVNVWLGIILISLMISEFGYSQTMTLQPPSVENANGSYDTKLLLKRDREFRLTWRDLSNNALNIDGTNAKLKIGRIPNTYDLISENVSGTSADFIPDNIELSPGRYYARISNSDENTTTAIQEDYEANQSSIIYSNEILLIVEASEAPTVIAPRGTIDNPSPTFQWGAVSGVPSYWLILSSTPFDIVEDENGDIAIEGATIVWQYVTSNTTGEYGDINPLSPFTVDAPPLNSGQEYSYTVLNVYEENNPTITSTVFGGVVPFTYIDPDALPVTTLESPANNEVFFAEETITFQWEEISSASNYTINLLQIVRQQGIDVTIPIWSTTTTNTLIEYPAIENLKNGRYEWNVITNNTSGGGSTSSSRFFNYEIETGEFAASLKSALDNSVILGAELTVRSISGGVSPSIPYFIQAETHFDSLVVGTYEFTATKDGFEDAIGTYEILDDRRTRFTLIMSPLPSSISGLVTDETNEAVSEAIVTANSISSDYSDETVSDANGNFSFSLNEGTYSISVSKTGFISPESQNVTVGLSEQVSASETFVLVNDEASISGTVFNEQGEPIQRAKVTITDGSNSYETNTNGSGLYQFIVSSGDWILSSEKIGFVKATDQDISLSTGDVVQNQNFTLTGNANQITGFVREQIINSDGTVGTTVFDDVEVTAIPNVGEPISTRTERNGQYTLSLRSGSYTIQAIEDNYTSNEDRELVIGIAIGETISGIDFELIPNPSSISGTVTLPNGNGVQDATVTIDNVGSTITSSSGFYEISVPEGAHTVTVVKNGLVSPDPKNIAVSVGQELSGVDFQMTPNAGTISGVITSGGESLSNTRIVAINTTSNTSTVLTNNLDGTYSFNLASGNWYLRAEKSGFLSDSTSILSVGPGQQIVNQNISLIENLTTVRGTVTDGIDALRNAGITVTRADGSNFEQSTVTQISGTYAVTLPAGVNYQIRASKNGYRSSRFTTSTLIAGETATLDFELNANPGSIAGVVTTNGARVLGNVKVLARKNGRSIDSTTTLSDGTYLLGLEPGTYEVFATRPGYTNSTLNTTLEIGQNITGVNFDVDENFALISGSITDSEGMGIEQVFVNLTKVDGVGASTVTDQNGSFNISGLTSGNFTINFSRTGFTTINESFSLEDGDFLNYDRVLTSKDGSISGVISDENGSLIDEATVTATNTEGISYTSLTDANGAYTITAVEPSSYVVNASKTGFTASENTNADVTVENLNLSNIDVTNLIPNNGVIQGTITDQLTGDPLKEAEISAIGERGSGFSLSASNGTFSISNLIPASYTLIVTKEAYKADTLIVSIDPTNPVSISNRELIQNNGSITGTVLDDTGNQLPFLATVIASSETGTISTQTNSTGEFTFDGVETGITYLIETDIYREGYENTSTNIEVPFGADEVRLDEALNVVVKQGVISGNVGLASTSLQLLDASSNQIVDLASSNSNGNYQFDFLAAGSYRVTVNRLGYIFSPDTSNAIILSSTSNETQNFSAQANIGTLAVVTTNQDGNAKSNVSVSIISADTTVILTKKTSTKGVAIFKDIKASTDYTVRASLNGFSSDPGVRTISLSSGDSTSVSFQLLANSSTVSGIVKKVDGSNFNKAKVTAILSSTGQTFETTTNQSGEYTFTNLAIGSYRLIATASGFTQDTSNIVLEAGSNLIADDLLLSAASANVQGFVFFKGDGVEDVEVTATSSSTIRTTTNSSGRYRFSNLPIKTGANDTTTYQISIKSGLFTRSLIVRLTSNDIGRTKVLTETNLPSGQINLIVTDGVNPLEGAILEFGLSGGESNRVVTGSSGVFASDNTLRKASYVVSVSKEGLLTPQNTIRYVLESDTSIIENEIALPYRQLSVPKILADARTKVSVVSPSGYSNQGATGTLYYKKESANSFSNITMSKSADSLIAFIPALNSVERIAFYTIVKDTIADNTFISRERAIKPLASGILTNVRVTPTLNGQILRVGEQYNLELFVRDGVNKSLEEEFAGDGSSGVVRWTNLSDTLGIQLSNQVGTTIQLNVIEAGDYSIRVTANLEGSSVSSNISFTAVDIPLESIVVGSPGKQLSNSASHVFSYSAIDTSGNNVLLGSSLSWKIEPAAFGSINQIGQFTPQSESLLGLFTVSVTDSVSGITGNSEGLELVASIQPDEAYTFNNGDGFELEFPSGAVDIPTQVSLTETRPAPSKKFVFAQGTDQSYTVGDRIYVLSLAGGELKANALLTLPNDSTFSDLNTGEREVGRFNFTTLQWELFENLTSKSSQRPIAGTISTDRFGQFAVLSANQTLGISNAAVLPSPFSPDIAPVKIGYWLDTAFPPAKVSIKIFNIRGELVRTLLEDALQQPGRYGSRSSSLEISWDGRTDAGLMARNGRYIVQIKAEDQQTEEVKLLQVILIK